MKGNNISIKLTGDKQVLAAIRKTAVQAPKALASSMHRKHEEVMTVAKTRTPVETGALRASGHVELPTVSGGVVKSEGGFGGPSAPYAIVVHENLGAHHPVGQAKFYESAWTDAEPTLASDLAQDLRRQGVV